MNILFGKSFGRRTGGRGLAKFWYAFTWLKNEGSVLWRALFDRETPMVARVAAFAVIFYVISPIDLVPDFIPFVGWIDDLIVIPLGIALVRGLVPAAVWSRAGGDLIERRGRRRGRNPMAYAAAMKDVTPR